LLRYFSKNLSADEHLVMLWEGAGFHHGNELAMPANITAIHPPAYCPEYYPIENLWHYLQSLYLSNRAQYVEELKEAVIQAWRDSVMDAELM
jgi:transposase